MSRIIGLTGGMGCGKSTVSDYLRQLQYPIVDADRVARLVVAPHTQGLAQLINAFGDGILQPNGALNRQKLGQRVFGDAKELASLNKITHPLILAEINRQLEALQEAPIVFLDIPLLLEGENYQTLVDEIWVVAISEEMQIQRIMARDGLSPREIRSRLKAQMPTEEKVKLANRVIDNSGTTRETFAQIDHHLAQLLKLT